VSVQSIMGGGGSVAGSFSPKPRAGGPGLADVVSSTRPVFEDRPHVTPTAKFAPRLTIKPAPKFEPRKRIDPTPIIEPRYRMQSDRVELSSQPVGMPNAVDRPMHAQVPWETLPADNIYSPDKHTDVVIKRAHAPSAGTLLDVFI